MYIVSKTSAVWVEDPLPQGQSTGSTPADTAVAGSESATHDAIGPGTRWAAHPLKLPHLICMGIRREGDAVRVAVLQRRKREWRDVASVLSPAQLQRWLAEGFVHVR